jgi:hypothetical protein
MSEGVALLLRMEENALELLGQVVRKPGFVLETSVERGVETIQSEFFDGCT